jgi:glycosyltransferase involved in cell wall biosynthesis
LSKYKVSIILTVYNRASYLPRCIESLIKQDFLSWELIAIDDGSTDDTLNILRSYEKDFPNIRVISHENMKIAQSRNKGIQLSSGEYVTFLDSDDEYEESHLSKRINFMQNNPDIDLIYGGVNIIGNPYVRDKDNPYNFIHLSKCFIGGTFFGKRNVFLSLGGFRNLEYSEDSDFIIRAKEKFNVEGINIPTYIYHRELSDSLTNNYVPA